MKRFYGSAVFEGVEVTDSAFTQLNDIRAEEARRVEYHKREFTMQIDELNRWRTNEIATINANTARQIDEQHRIIQQCYTEIQWITADLHYAIADARSYFFLKHNVRGSQDEIRTIAQLNSEAYSKIRLQDSLIAQCYSRIDQIRSEAYRAIATVHSDYKIEYNIRLTRRDKDIAWSHQDATDKIAVVIAKLYIAPIFMLRCARGPCEFCRAKYGNTGTRDELDKIECIPPFHDDCRCWLEEVGYAIMSH